MTKRELARLRNNIRHNWNHPIDWSKLPKLHFNCQMYAFNCTLPTEFYFTDTDRLFGIDLKICTKDGRLYFSRIGQFSENRNFSTVPELMEALKSDLSILGILAEECSFEDPVKPPYRKIAFYYSCYGTTVYPYGNFHFFVQENETIWSHKFGWSGGIKKVRMPTVVHHFAGLDLIGFFQLSLKQVNS